MTMTPAILAEITIVKKDGDCGQSYDCQVIEVISASVGGEVDMRVPVPEKTDVIYVKLRLPELVALAMQQVTDG